MDANTATNAVVQYLTETPEFKNLKDSRNRLAKNPAANEKVLQFQKKQEAVYSGGINPDQAQKIMDQLNMEYESLIQDPDARDYFQSNESFSRVLSQFIQMLNQALTKEL